MVFGARWQIFRVSLRHGCRAIPIAWTIVEGKGLVKVNKLDRMLEKVQRFLKRYVKRVTLLADAGFRDCDWARTDYQSNNELPQIPGIQRVEVKLRAQLNTEAEPGMPPAAHDQVIVDFNWDWTTRRPAFMELRGAYSDDHSQPVFSLRFNFVLGDDQPTPIPDNVIPLNQAQEKAMHWGNEQDAGDEFDQPRVRYYRLTHPIDFEWTTDQAREFQVEARGQCRVHKNISPNFNISAFGEPVRTTVYDPRPPAAPTLVMAEPLEAPLWASLPDAAGLSRIVLTWQKVTSAHGYVLYEATESSLLPLSKPTDVSQPFTARLSDLRNLIPNFKAQQLSFQRVNQELIKGDGNQISHEVTLPRGSRVIHIYAVTAVTKNSVESDWQDSSQNYFAVAIPRLAVPTPPTLEVTDEPDAMPPRVQLKIRAGPGIQASRVELYRTTKEENSKRLDRMGPPFISSDMTSCEMTFTDHPTAGWRRIWYRTAVWSKKDPLNGIVEARSPASPAVAVVLPPAAAPRLLDLRVNEPGSSETEVLISWASDAPVSLTPLGHHDAVVEVRSETGDLLPALTRRLDQIQLAASADALPPAPEGEIFRVEQGDSYRLYARLPRPPGLFFSLTVKMIDPLGRIGIAQRDVLQAALMHLPQLSPITSSTVKVAEVPQSERDQWEILSPIYQGALSRYHLSARIETLDFGEKGEGPLHVEPVEVLLGLDQIMGSALEISSPSTTLELVQTAGTQQFFLEHGDPVGWITVMLTDPLGRSATQSNGIAMEVGSHTQEIHREVEMTEVPDVVGLTLPDAFEKVEKKELIPVVGGTVLDRFSAIVDAVEPKAGTPRPLGSIVVLFPKEAI